MAHLLDGCWAKIERANEHIQYLTTELSRFLDANMHRYRVVGEVHPKTLETWAVVYDDGMEPPPMRYSVIIGEVLHHLRSSLDHLVWALALKRNPNPSDRVQFPICETTEKFERAYNQGIVNGISGSAVALMKGVQPYRERAPRKSPLFRLHALNNTEKHRLVIVAFGAIHGKPELIEISGELQGNLVVTLPDPSEIVPLIRPTKDGAKFVVFTLNRNDPTVTMNLNVPCTIALEQPGTGKLEAVIPCLTHLRDATVQTLELFRGEF